MCFRGAGGDGKWKASIVLKSGGGRGTRKKNNINKTATDNGPFCNTAQCTLQMHLSSFMGGHEKKNPWIENNWGTKRWCAMKIAVLTRHGEQAPMPSRQVCCATTRKQFGLACVESATSAVAAVRRRWPGTRLRGVAAQLTKYTHYKKTTTEGSTTA